MRLFLIRQLTAEPMNSEDFKEITNDVLATYYRIIQHGAVKICNCKELYY